MQIAYWNEQDLILQSFKLQNVTIGTVWCTMDHGM